MDLQEGSALWEGMWQGMMVLEGGMLRIVSGLGEVLPVLLQVLTGVVEQRVQQAQRLVVFP